MLQQIKKIQWNNFSNIVFIHVEQTTICNDKFEFNNDDIFVYTKNAFEKIVIKWFFWNHIFEYSNTIFTNNMRT